MKRLCIMLLVVVLAAEANEAGAVTSLGKDENGQAYYLVRCADKNSSSTIPFAEIRRYLSNPAVRDNEISWLTSHNVTPARAGELYFIQEYFEYSRDGMSYRTRAMEYFERAGVPITKRTVQPANFTAVKTGSIPDLCKKYIDWSKYPSQSSGARHPDIKRVPNEPINNPNKRVKPVR